MDFEINKLINSEITILQDLGWLLYRRENQNGGLTLDELEKLLKIVSEENINELIEVEDEYVI